MLKVAVLEQGWPELGLKSRIEIGIIVGVVAEYIYKSRRNYLYKGSFLSILSILL